MAIKSRILIAGNRQMVNNIIDCEYEFNQAIDRTGRPSDRPRGGIIRLTMPAPADDNLFFHEWMRDKDRVESGSIGFHVNNGGVIDYKSLSFTNAYCIGLKEHFSSIDGDVMTMQLTLVAEILDFAGGCQFKLID